MSDRKKLTKSFNLSVDVCNSFVNGLFITPLPSFVKILLLRLMWFSCTQYHKQDIYISKCVVISLIYFHCTNSHIHSYLLLLLLFIFTKIKLQLLSHFHQNRKLTRWMCKQMRRKINKISIPTRFLKSVVYHNDTGIFFLFRTLNMNLLPGSRTTFKWLKNSLYVSKYSKNLSFGCDVLVHGIGLATIWK